MAAVMLVGQVGRSQTGTEKISIVVNHKTVIMTRPDAQEMLTALAQALGVPNSSNPCLNDGQVHNNGN